MLDLRKSAGGVAGAGELEAHGNRLGVRDRVLRGAGLLAAFRGLLNSVAQ